MKRMTVCYPNNAIIDFRPHYDARMKVYDILGKVNAGYFQLPDYAGMIHFQARGYLYTAIKEDDVYSLKIEKIKAVS
jgi:hypothetical protein